MSLKSTMKKAAKIAFKIAGDIKIDVTFKNIVDDGMTEPIITETSTKAIRESFDSLEIRGLIFRDEIQPYDIKLIVLCDELPTIDTNDKVIINNIEYSVFGCQKDPANATWTIGIR